VQNWQKILIIIILIGGGVSVGIGWYLFSPLILSGPINEEDVELNDEEIVLTGEFTQIDSIHHGSGTVHLVNKTNSYYLQFVDVIIANGPSLIVYLSSKNTFSGTSDTPGDYYDLGALEFNQGNFTVEIPNEVDIENYNSVLIWCDPFQVVFTWATLETP
jgi:hypothetical protein